jgi:hypothetical protein
MEGKRVGETGEYWGVGTEQEGMGEGKRVNASIEFNSDFPCILHLILLYLVL